MKIKGGKVKTSEVKKFVEASYKEKKATPKKIGNYVLDEKLSNKKAKVYHDPIHNKTLVANRGTANTVADWTNNLKYATDVATGNVFNLYNKSDRFQQAKKTQKQAINKYGKVDTNIGHSQSGVITRKLNEKGLTDQVININPAGFYETPKKNEYTYRSTFDPVSAFTTGAKTASDFILNPVKAHSTEFLNTYHKKYLGGTRWSDYVKKFATENNIKYNEALKHPDLKNEWLNLRDDIGETEWKRIQSEKRKERKLKNKSTEEKKDAEREIAIIKNMEKYALKFIKQIIDSKYDETIYPQIKFKIDKYIKPQIIKDTILKENSKIYNLLYPVNIDKPKKVEPPTIKEQKAMHKEQLKENKKRVQELEEKALKELKEKQINDPLILMGEKLREISRMKVAQLKEILKSKKIKLSINGKQMKKPQMVSILTDEIAQEFNKTLPSQDKIKSLIETIKDTKFKETKPMDIKPINKLIKKIDTKITDKINIKKADKFRKKQLLMKTFKALKNKKKNNKLSKMNKVKQSLINEIEIFKKEIESFKNDKYNNTKMTLNEVNDLIKTIESKINLPSPIKTKESSSTIINKIENKLNEIQQIGSKMKEPLKYDADIGFTLFGYLYLIDKYDLPNILFGLMKNKNKFSITSYSLKFKPSFFFGDTKTKYSKDEEYLVNDITNINLSENKDFYKEFFTEIKNFIDNGEDLIFIPLCFDIGSSGHANMLIYRVSDGIIERFDPHGRSYYGSGEIGTRFNNQLNLKLKELFEVTSNKYLKKYTPVFQMIEPTDEDGFQAIESSFDKNIKDNQGYCQLWSLFFMELVALNKDIDSEELIDKSIEIGEASPQYFKEIITGYVSIIYKEMEQFVKKISKDYKINFEEKNLFTKHRDNKDLIDYFYKLKEDFNKKPKKNKIISVNVSKKFINSINKMDQDELDEYIETLEQILDTGKHIGYNGKNITNGERIQLLNELNYLKKK